MIYTFALRDRGFNVDFGPYDTEVDAKRAFQRRYGYWPNDALYATAYSVIL